ncbi:unnamed protein product [Oppiella nova]|uniref:Uncharacterized protein n=1 Tax=Oppiella nova TaxID=334625 RepID=A0A7R9LI08_9ACAR|nr:unnamed protein product [Oppiella nova]CAG2163857.1 unnamed protein product [Oppiella nova]
MVTAFHILLYLSVKSEPSLPPQYKRLPHCPVAQGSRKGITTEIDNILAENRLGSEGIECWKSSSQPPRQRSQRVSSLEG